MIVHITGGVMADEEIAPYLRKIIAATHEVGAQVAENWVETSHSRTTRGITPADMEWGSIVEQRTNSISRADAVIIEVTDYRLFHGFEMMLALEQNKPVLLVSRKSFKEFAISGYKNDDLSMKEYATLDELDAIVRKFIKENDIRKEDLTLKATVNKRLYRRLEKMSRDMGKTKSEILVDLANKSLGADK